MEPRTQEQIDAMIAANQGQPKLTYISELTEEQQAAMTAWADRWVAQGLSTEPGVYETALEGINCCYKEIQEEVPKVWIAVDSPMVMSIAHPLANYAWDWLVERGSVVDGVFYFDGYTPPALAEDWSAEPAKGKDNFSQKRITYTGATNAAYRVVNLLTKQKWPELSEEAAKSVALAAIDWAMALERKEDLQSRVDSEWSGYLGGNLWVAYPAYFTFFQQVCKLDLGDKDDLATAYAKIARSCGWWYGNERFIIMTNRPASIHMADGRLHRDVKDGFAIEWRDGMGLAIWRGVRVPSEWVTDGMPPANKILSIGDVEVRRCACEMIGWAKILELLDAKLVAAHDDPEVGSVYEVDLPGAPGARFLKALCATGREFAINIPNDCDDPFTAQALIHGYTNPADFLLPKVTA